MHDELLRWMRVVEAADWSSVADIRQDFNSVDYVKNDRYVFNIKGNQYRLVAMIHFRVRSLYIRFIGTHSAYDRINVSEV
ncbi:type II toxin-antitoxin system HigB family toxin [Spirosoma spitsbergense]|uniref:type II toxin-antitoxin system HigB family toxin n=1 Tax=Spirosoma spitsbergense TaxID=431554 RepID=UPI0024801347|nr:type II toxin-antitoxin system HigB family toxin [Spirosoma spitsbergense]